MIYIKFKIKTHTTVETLKSIHQCQMTRLSMAACEKLRVNDLRKLASLSLRQLLRHGKSCTDLRNGNICCT